MRKYYTDRARLRTIPIPKSKRSIWWVSDNSLTVFIDKIFFYILPREIPDKRNIMGFWFSTEVTATAFNCHSQVTNFGSSNTYNGESWGKFCKCKYMAPDLCLVFHGPEKMPIRPIEICPLKIIQLWRKVWGFFFLIFIFIFKEYNY